MRRVGSLILECAMATRVPAGGALAVDRDRFAQAVTDLVGYGWGFDARNLGADVDIDAFAIATGNDWRAIEAGAHAFAARSGRYTSLTKWSADENGNLCGSLEMPIKVGTVGTAVESNPTAALNLHLLGVKSATELAQVMGAAGLAQNFSAIRALATEGIQKGHMTLHARSVVTAAGAPAPRKSAI